MEQRHIVSSPIWELVGIDVAENIAAKSASAIPAAPGGLIALVVALYIARRYDLFGVKLRPETCQKHFKWDEPTIVGGSSASPGQKPESDEWALVDSAIVIGRSDARLRKTNHIPDIGIHVISGSLVVIRNGDELAGLLRKAHEIESGFESVVQWEGYVNVADSEMRAVLFELISDSNEHRRIVESLLAMARTSKDAGGPPLQPRTFNFKGKSDIEVMNEIAKVEKVMFDMYSDIRSAVDASDLKSLVSDAEDAERFVSHLNTLVEGEAKHMAIVARYVRKVDRLR